MPIIVGIAIGLAVILLIEFLLIYFILFRKFKKISISLNENEIVYNNLKGTQIIKYDDITKLSFPSIKYTGGWVKIHYNGGNIRLTVVLEKIGDFVKELKDILDERNMSNVYNEKKLYNFYKTATYSDQSWDRLYSMFSKLLGLEVVSSLIGLLFNFLTTSYRTKIFFSFIALTYPIFSFIISEFILGRILSKTSKTKGYNIEDRDAELEKKVYKNTFIIMAIVSVLLISYNILF